MLDTLQGPSTSLELLPSISRKNVALCIICQKIKDSQGDNKLTKKPEILSDTIQKTRISKRSKEKGSEI